LIVKIQNINPITAQELRVEMEKGPDMESEEYTHIREHQAELDETREMALKFKN
jgi:hypothetical protein